MLIKLSGKDQKHSTLAFSARALRISPTGCGKSLLLNRVCLRRWVQAKNVGVRVTPSEMPPHKRSISWNVHALLPCKDKIGDFSLHLFMTNSSLLGSLKISYVHSSACKVQCKMRNSFISFIVNLRILNSNVYYCLHLGQSSRICFLLEQQIIGINQKLCIS